MKHNGHPVTARSIRPSQLHAQRLMRTLCRKIGSRTPASDGMRRAQDLLENEWLVLDARGIRREPVPLRAWREGRADVTILAPASRHLDAVQAVNSTAASAEASLVDGGRLCFADLQRLGDSVRNAVVLVDGHVLENGQLEPLQKRVSIAEVSGAAAVLVAGTYAPLPAIMFLHRSCLPVLSISGDDARQLRRMVRTRQQIRVRVRTTGRGRRATCHNLIADFGPTDAGAEQVIACAHMDTFYLSPAAMDNTSGVVAMTEMARLLAPYQNRFVRKLRLIAFTGEEYGFAGSKHYVHVHSNELDRVRFVLSMDCMFPNTAKGLVVIGAPEMSDYVIAGLRNGARQRVDVRNGFCMSSDYLPFVLAGVPAARPADFGDTFPPYTHTIADTDDKIPPAWLNANAKMCAHVLLRMLTDPRPLPARRRSADEVRRLVESAGAQDLLRWQVQLPA